MAILNQFLIGDICANLVMVGGGDDASFTDRDKGFIVDQTEKAFSLLKDAEPRARLNFIFASHITEVESVPIETSNETDEMERNWRISAMQNLGFDDFSVLLEEHAERSGCVQGFVILVTDHRVPHFAYSTPGKVIISCRPNNYGKHLMHVLIAHEICHLFNAADETGSCNCDRLHGYLKASHDNCYICNSNPVPCIMAANSKSICDSTRKQIGWGEPLLLEN